MKQSTPLPTVRAGPLMDLPVVVRKLGHDPEAIFAECGFKLSQFLHPDSELPYLPTARLIEHCMNVTGCEHIGLLIGERIGLSSFGIVGFIMRFEATVDSALDALLRYLDLHDSGGHPHLERSDDFSTLGYSVNEPAHTPALEQISDLSTTHAFNILADLCGAHWRPVRVELARREPADTSPYEALFRTRLVFNAKRNGVVFPTSLLSVPLASHEPHLLEQLEGEARRLKTMRPSTLAEQVDKCLRLGAYGRPIVADQIATMLGMSERTLHRRLRSEGTGFRQLLQRHRHELACLLLETTTMTMREIALALNYTSEAAFNRAFRRWTGASPARWRASRMGS